MPRVRSDFLVKLAKLKEDITKSRNPEAGRDWLRVQRFAESGVGLPYRKADELARLVILGYSDTYIAEKFNVTNETIRYHRKNVSDALYKYLGNDFLTLFSNYEANKKEIRHRLAMTEICLSTAESLFPLEIVNPYCNGKYKGKKYSLLDCEAELAFLGKYSLRSIKSEIQALNSTKLTYLLWLIGGGDGMSVNDRLTVLSRLVEGNEEFSEEEIF